MSWSLQWNRFPIVLWRAMGSFDLQLRGFQVVLEFFVHTPKIFIDEPSFLHIRALGALPLVVWEWRIPVFSFGTILATNHARETPSHDSAQSKIKNDQIPPRSIYAEVPARTVHTPTGIPVTREWQHQRLDAIHFCCPFAISFRKRSKVDRDFSDFILRKHTNQSVTSTIGDSRV